MPTNTTAILADIDSVLARYEQVEKEHCSQFRANGGELVVYINAPRAVAAEIVTLLRSTITRLAPPGYGGKAMENVAGYTGWESETIRSLAGVVKALRSDYAEGRMQSLRKPCLSRMNAWGFKRDSN
jgi:hypothetical protein